MSTISFELREKLVRHAHRQRNREIRRLVDRLFNSLIEEPKPRNSRWIAAHRGW
jgi:hypothetical protein